LITHVLPITACQIDINKYATEEFFAEKNREVLETILREKLYMDKKYAPKKARKKK
jgi:hypothetical protein